MNKAAKTDPHVLHCSFCHKGSGDVAKLVAGPGVYICNECIDIAHKATIDTPVPNSWARAGGGFVGWEEVPEEQVLKWLKPSIATLDAISDDLQKKIDSLRKRDVSWARIGEALGISRQAAWERFS